LFTGEGGAPAGFLRARNLNGALDGDLVLVRPLAARGGKPPRDRRLPEATVVRVLNPRSPTLVGRLERDRGMARLQPFDPKERLEVLVDAPPAAGQRDFVVVEVERRALVDGRRRGRVVEVLGDPDVPGVDVEVVLRHFGIGETFPEEVL